MRILVCSWGNICEPDLELSLLAMGHEVDVLKAKIKSMDYDVEYLKRMSNDYLLKYSYDCVFSINYVPVISRLCNLYKIKYISWIVDSPWYQLNSDTVTNPCNYIFIFDQKLYKRYVGRTDQIYYMPLGANVRFWDSITVTKEEKELFATDVSFVGSLYEDKHSYDKIELPDSLKGYLDGVIEAQSYIFGYNFLNEVIRDVQVEEFCQSIGFDGGNKDYQITKKEMMLTEFLGKKCAEVERHRYVKKLAKNCKFDLYTLSNTSEFPYINNKGAAESRIVMPKIFKCSKINLNMTIKTIESGIPLRVYDVLGNGGFLITNFQSELLEYFIPDVDLVIYENEEDLLSKISYYLKHEEERIQIARNGYNKVKSLYTYEKRLEKIIEIVWQDKKICHGLKSISTLEKNHALMYFLEQIKVGSLLDIGMFLERAHKVTKTEYEALKSIQMIDAVEFVYEQNEEQMHYNKIYQFDKIPSNSYDLILAIDILNYISVAEATHLIQILKQFSGLIVTEYQQEYEEIFNRIGACDLEKITAGQSDLMLAIFD